MVVWWEYKSSRHYTCTNAQNKICWASTSLCTRSDQGRLVAMQQKKSNQTRNILPAPHGQTLLEKNIILCTHTNSPSFQTLVWDWWIIICQLISGRVFVLDYLSKWDIDLASKLIPTGLRFLLCCDSLCINWYWKQLTDGAKWLKNHLLFSAMNWVSCT